MDQSRLDALVQAVVARQENDTPQSIVQRAEQFHAFLDGSRDDYDREG